MVAIDLFCGLGGWADGFLAEGYDVIGYDIERHDYGAGGYPGHLILQDVLTLDGAQFAGAAVIVASPPCQAYSYRAMPWKRAKALPPPDNSLFDACFRIQREAIAAAGHHIPLIVENVRGAEKWVGRAKWHFGSYYLWGDVPALMPITLAARKCPGFRFDGSGKSFQSESVKVTGQNWSRHARTGETTPHWRLQGLKQVSPGSNGWFGKYQPGQGSRNFGSHSLARKRASAEIAKIPFPLAQHIARSFKTAENPDLRTCGVTR